MEFRAAMERALLARRPKLPPRRVRLSLCGFPERTKRGTVVPTNKCLAKSNKSRHGGITQSDWTISGSEIIAHMLIAGLFFGCPSR